MTTPARHDRETPPFWARFKASRFYDPISRAYHSFAQEFGVRALPILAALAVAGGITDDAGRGFLAALIAGAGSAVSSLLLSAVTLKVRSLSVPLDTAIRLVRTAVGSVAGLYSASLLVDDQSLVTFGWAAAVYGAVVTALASLVKTYLVNGAAGGNDVVQGRIDAQRDLAVPKA